MGQNSEEFIGTSVRAMGLCECRLFFEILLQNVMWRSIDIVFTPTLLTKRRVDRIVGDGVCMHPPGYCLRFGCGAVSRTRRYPPKPCLLSQVQSLVDTSIIMVVSEKQEGKQGWE